MGFQTFGGRDNDRTLGILPLIIGAATAAAGTASSLLDSKASRDASRAAETQAQQQVQAARLQLRAEAASSKKWLWIAGAVAVVGIGVTAYAISRRKKR